jgi:multidrug efflux pump subunit AcrB
MIAFAAVLSTLPLMIGVGSELPPPLGIPIVHGFLVGQALPLFTTRVSNPWFDRQSRYFHMRDEVRDLGARRPAE